MTDYTPNSHKYKAENKPAKEKNVTKVVSGTVKTRKKNELQKMTGAIISEDARNVKSYILMDVLLPAVKDAIEDIVTNGIRMLLRGDTKARSGGSSNISRISYNKAYDSRDRGYSRTSRTRTGYNFDDIILETRGEAEEVLDSMDDMLDRYEAVSVSDLYDLIGERCPFTAEKYGWYNLRNASVVRVRNGYMLKLPKAVPLD